MGPAISIEKFLEQVGKKRSRVSSSKGLYLLLTLTIGGLLAANSIAYFSSHAREIAPFFIAVWSILFLVILTKYFLRGAFAKFNPEQTALLVEEKVDGLDNSLINSVQLKNQLENPDGDKSISFSFIRELVQRTTEKIQGIEVDSLIDEEPVARDRNIFLGTLAIFLATVFIAPDFFRQGYDNFLHPSAPTSKILIAGSPDGSTSPAKEQGKYAVKNISLTFNYPAYTQLKRVVMNNSDGKIDALPGTEVRIRAEINLPVSGAELILNGKDHFSMSAKEKNKIAGQFMTKSKGYYQFRLKTPDGKKILLPEKYPISTEKDQPPQIKIFLANPKPVYHLADKVQFYYEANDDFGLSQIDLVFDVNGNIRRKAIKKIKTMSADIKGGHLWELSIVGLKSGDLVRYFLEVKDNDNVLGPNTGQSEMFSFEIFDALKRREDLIALQDQLLDEMVDLLASTLIVKFIDANGRPVGVGESRKILASNTDHLIHIIGLAQDILSQASLIESFPAPYITLLTNIVDGLNQIREEHIHMMNRLTSEVVKTSTLGFNFPPLEPMNDKLTNHLEKDILLLVKIINRERMNQVMNFEKELTDLAETLREEFEKLKDGQAPNTSFQFKKAIKKMKEALQKIMEQLAKQTRGLPDEFLNPNAFKDLNIERFTASLDKIMDLANQGKFDQAMKELENFAEDLRSLSNQLDQENTANQDLLNVQLMRQLDKSLQKVKEMEKKQQKLLKETTEINQKLRKKQSSEFEKKLRDLFEELKLDVQDVRRILDSDKIFLGEHRAMKEYADLLNLESSIRHEVNDLNQKAINSFKDADLALTFKKLNRARARLSSINRKIHSRRLKIFQGFKAYIPQLDEKYSKLEELAELHDLHEFDSLFKSTYPEVFRWQNQFRTSRKPKKELTDRINEDMQEITRLNSEISKKLGTMLRELEQNYQSLLTQENKQKLDRMARQQGQMKKSTDKLSQTFEKMNQENPMIGNQLSNKMKGTGEYINKAEQNLKQHNIPDSIESENKVLSELAEAREFLKQLKDVNQAQSKSKSDTKTLKLGTGRAKDKRKGGSVRMQKERVTLPSEDQYRVPGQFREDILKAMKKKFPKDYERMVMEYYKELVK